MNTGTPVIYVDKDGNEWAGMICGRTWVRHQLDGIDTNGQPFPVERNETGAFNVLCTGHDGHQRIFEGIDPGALTVADLTDDRPVFATKATRQAPSYGLGVAPAAPAGAPFDMAALAAMVGNVVDAKLSAAQKPKGKRK